MQWKESTLLLLIFPDSVEEADGSEAGADDITEPVISK